MRTGTQPRIRKMAGISYVEVLVSVVLIAIVLVPAMEALQPGMAGSGIHEIIAEDHYRLTGKFEEVLAEPFVDLDIAAITAGSATTATAYSDVFTYPNGRQITRNVFIAQYEADNADSDNDPFTGIDIGLLWVQVEIAGTELRLETLINE